MTDNRAHLPDGWVRETLGGIGKYHNGRGFKKSEWSSAGRPIIRIQNLTDASKPFNHFAGTGVDPRNEVSRGDLLVSWAATLGVFRWDGPDAVLNQHIFKVESAIDPGFHYYVLRAAIADLYAQSHGSGMVHITKGRFNAVPVLLPPIDEQRRIAAQLDVDLAAHQQGVERLLDARRGTTRLRLALTRDALDGDWPLVPLSETLISLRNGIFVSRPDAEPPGIPIYRISAVRPMALSVDDLRYAPPALPDHDRFLVNPGDLLFTRYSGNPELVGACARVPEGTKPALHPDKLIRGVVNERKALPAFLELACSAGTTWAEIRAARKTTAGQVGIAGRQLAAVRVPLPPLDVQDRIVRECQVQLEAADGLDRDLARWLREADTLKASMLRHAVKPNPTSANALAWSQ